MVEGAEGEGVQCADEGLEVWNRGWDERAALVEAGLDCTVEVYMSEESKEGVTVIRKGGQFQERKLPRSLN